MCWGRCPSRPTSTPSQNVNIGRRAGGYRPRFQGTIDEVRIYNRALTAAEVAADMTTPVDQRGPTSSRQRHPAHPPQLR